MRKSWGFSRNFVRGRAVSAAITANHVAERISTVLRRQVQERRYAAQRIAEKACVTPRCVDNWVNGTTAPRSAELIRLMASCDEIAAEVLQLVEEARACSRS